MINKLRARIQDEKGFTLIELLVVILIIGILAAIALPAFLNQRAKAQDSTAKSDVRTAQTAMETYFTDSQTYVGAKSDPTGADKASLQFIEPALKNAKDLDTGTPTATAYSISVTTAASSGAKFIIANNNGVVTRTCDKPGEGGCPASGKW
jgi:type IV pilus assembly protein PilA